jgi:hypothetical protein
MSRSPPRRARARRPACSGGQASGSGCGLRCRRTIYSTDQIGWRYYTKDLQWIAIKDLRWGDNDGTWMFIPSGGNIINTPCHVSGCWWIG